MVLFLEKIDSPDIVAGKYIRFYLQSEIFFVKGTKENLLKIDK